MAAKKIDVSFNENYAILRMKSGENRLNPEFLREFNCALDEIESHKDVAFMITTGEGKYFSLGLDLDFMRKATMGEAEKVFTGFPALHLRLLTLPFPTIAALNGHAFGGGALLALAHDYRIMRTERGWFSINEIRLGLHMGKANALLTREKIKDPKTLSDAVLTGKRFSAQEAFSGGPLLPEKIGLHNRRRKKIVKLSPDSCCKLSRIQLLRGADYDCFYCSFFSFFEINCTIALE
ncbi:uncharacterized protein [Montipora capricornis]|uniref:uncharacterized protein isoform X2 n=1 Tax=Montipora capricornis TaxID=246305 RepID=UPI0035F124F6